MSSYIPFPSASITQPKQLNVLRDMDMESISRVHATYPMRISNYYFQLIKKFGTPLLKQAVPDIRELHDPDGLVDPLDEENLSPVPNLVHKYPDRALFLISNQCSVYCRFCTRKRKVGKSEMVITDQTIADGITYIKQTPAIRDVLLSGGDPLMLTDQRLEKIIQAVRLIPHVVTIRIGTRIPCTLPERVTPELAQMLGKYHPLYINTHFNHPAEITLQSSRACSLLADAGIPLGCQTVLLRGINDDPDIIRELMYKLIQIRVKPYYLFQADLTRGTSHFRTSIETGMAIMRHLIGHVSGMAIPTYALDAPGGGGKIPLTPDYITSLDNTLQFTTYQGKSCSYPNTTID
ncbi:KamA family radical SAM protein [Desulfogranum marinum]|uniref:KamA family radical SAM protein n=1 Tax=Desulfogranum marinum TaxID=453220 RepID=UPI00196383E5|nr:KamA family radical SAM protein [Desulfogranum marinum]MBM9510777.1 KamA family radical SAM protein [Desulfogranum marinum]